MMRLRIFEAAIFALLEEDRKRDVNMLCAVICKIVITRIIIKILRGFF